ncbi:hypothetical protein ACLOJK_003505 [Asimina triloba]
MALSRCFFLGAAGAARRRCSAASNLRWVFSFVVVFFSSGGSDGGVSSKWLQSVASWFLRRAMMQIWADELRADGDGFPLMLLRRMTLVVDQADADGRGCWSLM